MFIVARLHVLEILWGDNAVIPSYRVISINYATILIMQMSIRKQEIPHNMAWSCFLKA